MKNKKGQINPVAVEAGGTVNPVGIASSVGVEAKPKKSKVWILVIIAIIILAILVVAVFLILDKDVANSGDWQGIGSNTGINSGSAGETRESESGSNKNFEIPSPPAFPE